MKASRLLAVLVLIGGIWASAGCKGSQQGKGQARREQKDAIEQKKDSLLLGTWMESHEERGASGMPSVWRNVKYHTFPPARGRTGFNFLPEGRCIYLAIAPTDGTEEQPGLFAWNGPKTIKITLENGRLITLRVKELTAEKLDADWSE